MVIIRIWEGLGNQLFQYSYARSLKEEGIDVKLDLAKVYDNTFEKARCNTPRQNCIQNFNITIPEIDVEEYGKYQYIKCENMKDKCIYALAQRGLWAYRFYEETNPGFSKKMCNIRGNYYIKGWFQSEKYFKRIRKILLSELTPKKKIQISKQLHKILEYDECVSLHVRRGDFVRASVALNASYYKAAIALIKERYKAPLFLVFSDDFEWVEKYLDNEKNCIYINRDRKLQDYEELLIMSRCKSNIISNSTFSWWGAWLNRNPEKIVIAPKMHWIYGDGFPEKWVVI